MGSLLERKLIVVTGKGGTGKSTVAGALGLLAASRGLRTIVVEVGDQRRLPELFERNAERPADGDYGSESGSGGPQRDSEPTDSWPTDSEPTDSWPTNPKPGIALRLETNLWAMTIDPERALFEWLRTLGGPLSVRLLSASSSFHYFAAAAPGAKELLSMVKLRELCEGERGCEGTGRYDLVVMDAPATGHALAMLRSPQTFAAVVSGGPLAEQSRGVRELLEDRRRTGYLAVAQASEMAVSETLELEEGLRMALDRDLDAIVVNGTLPRRFSKQELARIEGGVLGATSSRDASSHRNGAPGEASRSSGDARLLGSAAIAARSAYRRAQVQQSQIARLRRQHFGGGRPPDVLTIPLAFTEELDLGVVQEIATQLGRKL